MILHVMNLKEMQWMDRSNLFISK